LSAILKTFADRMIDKTTWWVILDCGHWYHWTGDDAPHSDVPCPSCRKPSVARRADNRSKHPIFKGQRFVVFDWQLEGIERLLGRANLDAFAIDEFFYVLDAAMTAADTLVPTRDGGVWLQEQVLAEAQRRGLHVAAPVSQRFGKQTTRLMQAVQRIQHEARKRDAG
jgi:hypothetical protein